MTTRDSKFLPQFAEYHGFVSPTDRAKYYRELSKDMRKELLETLAPNVYLYRLPTKYFVLDEAKEDLLYYMSIKRGRYMQKEYASQLEVWRKDTALVVDGLATRIFFDYLLPSTRMVITDKQHSDLGKRFWGRCVARAFADGKTVSFIDMSRRLKQQVMTLSDFERLVPRYYGDGDEFQNMRIAIES